MYAFLRKSIAHFLNAIYQPFLFALVLSVFVMFFVMYLGKYKNVDVKQRILNGFKEWMNNFKKSKKFRRIFYFVFIAVMILFKTLLVRSVNLNPT